MNLLFDTNILIGFLKNDNSIVDKMRNVEEINVSVITVGEMLFGAQNSKRKEENKKCYQSFFSLCNILPIDTIVSEAYSEIRIKLKELGQPIPENDIWIIATAQANGLKIVSRDKHIISCDFIEKTIW